MTDAYREGPSERKESGEEAQIAKTEYGLMRRELSLLLESGTRLEGGEVRASSITPPFPSRSKTINLPRLPVPIGRITHVSREKLETLPVVGLLLRGSDLDAILAGLSAFFVVHHTAPFCRPIMIVEDTRLLPFIGRFGFAYHKPRPGPDASNFAYLSDRMGMVSVRSIQTGELLWQEEADGVG